MFKLVVLSVLLAVAAARPGYLGSPFIYSPTSVIHEPVLAKVGSIVKSIPTAVSHQSQSIVHSSAHYETPIVAPVAVKTTYTAPIIKTYAAPAVYASYAAHGPALHYTADLAHPW